MRNLFAKLVAYLTSASLNFDDPPLDANSPLLRVFPRLHLDEFGMSCSDCPCCTILYNTGLLDRPVKLADLLLVTVLNSVRKLEQLMGDAASGNCMLPNLSGFGAFFSSLGSEYM